MLRCAGTGRVRAPWVGVVIMVVVGLVVELGLRQWRHAAAHEPAAKLLIVGLVKWATFGALMVYWILPPLMEQLRTGQRPRGPWLQLMLVRWGRVIVSGLIVGAVTIAAEGLTGLVWH